MTDEMRKFLLEDENIYLKDDGFDIDKAIEESENMERNSKLINPEDFKDFISSQSTKF